MWKLVVEMVQLSRCARRERFRIEGHIKDLENLPGDFSGQQYVYHKRMLLSDHLKCHAAAFMQTRIEANLQHLIIFRNIEKQKEV